MLTGSGSTYRGRNTVSTKPATSVQLPTTDGRTVVLSLYSEPELDKAILLQRLQLSLPPAASPGLFNALVLDWVSPKCHTLMQTAVG